jgi:ABC-2 type transport system permease protein
MLNFIRLWTLIWKEIHRFLKVWQQTVISPIITAVLYFAVFGAALSSRISEFDGVPYVAFIVPGLALLQATTAAFQNPSSSLIIAKYHGTIDDLLTTPLTALEKTLGFLIAGTARGMLVAVIIFLVAAVFVPDFWPEHPLWLLLVLVLVNAVFALAGTLTGIWAQTFDQTAGPVSYLITPMAFLGGVFYSLSILPAWAQTVSLINPFVYFVDAARWAMFDVSTFDPLISIGISLGFFVVFFSINYWAFVTSWRLRD